MIKSIFFITAITTLFAGCVPVPKLFSDRFTYIKKKEINLIQVGHTHREDVRQQLGLPDLSFDDGSTWLYVAKSHRAGGVALCFIGLSNTNNPNGSTSCMGEERPLVITYLDLKFDDSNIIERRELITAKQGECTKSKVCFDEYGSPMLYGSIDDDAKAKEFETDPAHCAVYLYANKALDPPMSIFAYIDEVDTGHGFRPGNGFLQMNLATGTREITVSSHPLNCAKPSESINFDCEADSVLFIRELHDDTGAFSLSSVSSMDGTSAILKRKLILLKDKDVE